MQQFIYGIVDSISIYKIIPILYNQHKIRKLVINLSLININTLLIYYLVYKKIYMPFSKNILTNKELSNLLVNIFMLFPFYCLMYNFSSMLYPKLGKVKKLYPPSLILFYVLYNLFNDGNLMHQLIGYTIKTIIFSTYIFNTHWNFKKLSIGKKRNILNDNWLYLLGISFPINILFKTFDFHISYSIILILYPFYILLAPTFNCKIE